MEIANHQLKSLLHELKDFEQKVEIHFHIDRVYVDIKDIKDLPLTLHFDKIDVKENSGHINFGNNFSSIKQIKQERNDQQTESDEIVVRVNGKRVDHYIE